MTFRKFAYADIIDARMGEQGIMKNAHRAVFNYTPRPGYLYVRSRAISSRCNDNYDMFPAEEIAKAYKTFIGKPVFVNHHNDDHRRARGIILDAALHRDKNPDGSPDTWAEVLMEVDAMTFPKLAKAIIAGEVNRTSMGTDVEISKCSVCGNKASSPAQYCQHIPAKKGKRIVHAGSGEPGKREAKLVYEECYGLSFFENSLLVEQPADPTAFFLGEVEYGPGLEHLAKTASTGHGSRTFETFSPNPLESPRMRSMNSLQSEASWQKTAARIQPATTSSSNSIWDLIKTAADDDEYANAAEKGLANDHVRSFQGRKVPDHGDRVAVYRDLSGAPKSGYPARGSWSIKRLSDRGGKSAHVYAHTVGLHVTNAEPTFDEGARQHFKEEEKRGVHAYIAGSVHHYAHPLEPGEKPDGDGWRQVSYYPDISHFFMKDTRNKYHGSDEAAFRGGSMWARGNIKEGTDGPVPQSKFEQPRTGKIWNFIYEADLIGDDLDNDLRDRDPVYWNRLASIQPPTSNWKFKAVVAKLNDDHPYTSLVPPKNQTEMSDDEKKEWAGKVKDHAQEWMKRNPVHPQNIVDHWNAATPEEKENGMNWYHDAHHTARIIAEGTNTPMHAMAGLVSNYSPQTHWATNVINAAKVARTKVAIGGKGNKHGEPALVRDPKTNDFVRDEQGKTISTGVPRGIMASEGQRRTGQALVDAPHDEDEARAQGNHYEQLLKGPKTQAFARLIHNGGDDHSVVVDRHAFSVASGARASDAAYGHSGLGGKKRYAELEGHYRTAAKMISDQEGHPVHPHQVQAATWLVRQRLNEAGDRELVKKGSRSASAARSSIAEMHHYMGEHHPEASIQMPGTGYSKETGLVTKDITKSSGREPNFSKAAYGETKAPQDVDTLRPENCTVCGNSTAYDGTQCQVCGYVAPPRPFGDPDVDTAKSKDIRKQVLDSADGTADPNDPDQQLGNQIGDPGELQDQADDAQAQGVSPAITCTNCGTGIIPTPAKSEGDTPPYPAEGDVCPVCKKGELLSQSDPDEDADQDGVPDEEEDAEIDPDAGNDPNVPFGKNKDTKNKDKDKKGK